MATTVARLQAVLTADTSNYDRQLDQSQDRTHKFSKVGIAALGGITAAVAGLGVAAKIGWDEFSEASKVGAQTDAVLKSTGASANVTKGQIEGLATAIMKKSGIDDEAVQSGENMLLTFTNIRNETGKGNDVFNQSTSILADMSTAMGTDMSKQAIQLGKALNDPIKGVGALSRVGVQFTTDQRESIKAMVDAGNTMGAQKLILAELHKEFGGSAEAAGKTLPGQLNILKQTFNNLAGEMVSRAIPYVLQFTTKMQELMPRLQEFVAQVSGYVQPVVAALARIIRENVIPVIQQLAGIARATWESIRSVLEDNQPEIHRIMSAISTLARTIGNVLLWLAQEVWLPILKVMFTVGIPTALRITINVIDAVIKAIEGLKDGFVWLRDKAGPIADAFRDAVMGPVNSIRDAFNDVKQAIDSVINALRWVQEHGGGLLKKVGIGDVSAGFNDVAAQIARAGTPSGGLQPQTSALLSQLTAKYGNIMVTSGYRSPEENERVGGAPNSDHMTGRAFDIVPASGWNPATIAMFDQIAAWLGGLASVRWIGWRGVPGHGPYDHLHVSTFDKGGYLKPGWNLAYNGLGRNEALIASPSGGVGPTINVFGVVGDAEDVARKIRDAISRLERRG